MTRQQRWAAATFAAVKRVADLRDETREKKYATHCMKAPTLLRQAGLVQALAFLRTRGDEGKLYTDDLAAALGPGDGKGEPGERLQRRAQALGLRDYMALSRDAAAVAVWMRRFAQAELKQEDD